MLIIKRKIYYFLIKVQHNTKLTAEAKYPINLQNMEEDLC